MGGGVAGLALALAASDLGLRVTVLERGRMAPRRVVRGEILQPNGLSILERLGVLEALRARAEHPVSGFDFRDDRHRMLLTIRYAGLPSPHRHVLIVLPDLLRDVLISAVTRRRELAVWEESGVASFHADPEGVELEIAGGRRLRAEVLVGADGSGSLVRRQAGIRAQVHAYRDGYLTTVVERPPGLSDPGRYYLGRRAILGLFPLADGGLYLFSLAPGATPPTGAGEIERWKEAWIRLEPELEVPLKAVRSPQDLQLLHCFRVRARPWVSGRVALVGDAAHAMNPHAAQGTNQALEDAVALAPLLAASIADRRWGRLERYEEARRPAVRSLQRLGDDLTWLWNSGHPLVIAARNRVLRRIDTHPELKQKILCAVAGLDSSGLSVRDRLIALGLLR